MCAFSPPSIPCQFWQNCVWICQAHLAPPRRLTDLLRSEHARRRRDETVTGWSLTERGSAGADERQAGDVDDTLVLLLLCCHPSLSVTSQLALTLRAVGGLSCAEIARALLGSDQTVTRRITRAKQSIRGSHLPFALPGPGEMNDRLDAALRVLYLIFTEGHARTTGATLLRGDQPDTALRAVTPPTVGPDRIGGHRPRRAPPPAAPTCRRPRPGRWHGGA